MAEKKHPVVYFRLAMGSNKSISFVTQLLKPSTLISLLVIALMLCSGASAQFATGGGGLYKNNILWFSWGGDGASLTLPLVKSYSFTSGSSTLSISCTLSNLSNGTLRAYRPGNWGGDGLDDLYNIGGTGTSNTLVSGIRGDDGGGGGISQSFTFSCIGSINGASITLPGIIMADAEQSMSNEYLEASATAGGTWRMIDRFRTSGCTSSNTLTLTTNTLRMTGVVSPCSSGPMGVAYLDGGTSASVLIHGGGISAISLGVMVNSDFGDAPASYGNPQHLNVPSLSSGVVPNGTSDLFSLNPLATLNSPSLFLGSSIDYETGSIPSASANGDDTNNTDDEDGVTLSANISQGQVVSVPVLIAGTGNLNAWFDWNRDGDFLDAGEQVANDQTVLSGTTNLNVLVPATASVGTTYARFRICSSTNSCNTPTSVSITGEIEDYSTVVNAAPSFRITKSSNGPWTIGQSGAQYTLGLTNNGSSASSGTITVRDALPTGITPNWSGTLTTSGFSCTFSGQNVTCTRTTSIASAGTASLVLPVNVTTSTPTGTNSITNYASVGGGGDLFNGGVAPTAGTSCTDANHCASNPTTINPAPALQCGPVYASEFTTTSPNFYKRIYLLSGNALSVFGGTPAPTQNVATIGQGTDTRIYFDNGVSTTNYYAYNGNTTATISSGLLSFAQSGPGGGWDGNQYYVGTNFHLIQVTPTGAVSDLGAVIAANASDSVLSTLSAGDVASDANGRLFWYSSVGGTGLSYLYRIDKNTLKATDVGQVGPNGASGLAFDSSNNLITTSVNSSTKVTTIYSINLTTFAATNVGTATGLQASGGMVYDLASCNMPTLNPVIGVQKSVANITLGQNPATIAQVGNTLEYTITVTNSGNITSDSTTLSDAIPSGTTYVAGSTTLNGVAVADVGGKMPYDPTGTGPRYINSPGKLTGNVEVGSADAAVIKFRVTVNASGLPANISNAATVSSPTVSNGVTTFNNITSASADVPSATPDLTITKSHSGNFTVGSSGTYTFTVANSGTAASSGTITVSDTLPTGLTVNGGAAGAVTIGGTNAANWTCNSNAANPQVITCTSSTAIAISGSSTFSIAVNVGASTPTGTNSITNTATVSGGGEGTAKTGNNTASDPTTVLTPPPLTCGPVYASEFSGSTSLTFYNRIYLLSGSVLTVYNGIAAPASPVGTVGQGTDTKIYFDDGSNVSNYYSYSGSATATVTTGLLSFTQSGPGGGWDGNQYYVGSNFHLIQVTPSGTVNDLGAITASSASDTIFSTLRSGDVASDANGRLFWYSSVNSNGSSYLYRIDKNTLKASNMGQIGPNGASGLAFDSSNNLITTTVDFTTRVTQIYSINLATYATTYVGSASGFQASGGMVYDLASCNMPTLNPVIGVQKSVANITLGQNPATIAQVGNTLEYTITVTNSGNITSDSTTLSDAIPSGTTYVAGSTTLNGVAVADVGGKMPYDPTGTGDRLINSPGKLPGDVEAGTSDAAVIKFRVTVNASGLPANISNAATVSSPTVSNGVTTFNNITSASADVPAQSSYSISGVIYADLQPNSSREPSESWSSGTSVYVNLVQGGSVLQSVAVAAGTGAYSFANVPNGSYSVVVANSATAATAQAPSGWLFINPNGSQSVTVSGANVINQDFGLFHGSKLSGTVFMDDGLSSGTANDALQNGGEQGIGNVPVTLSDGSNTLSSTTLADGSFSFYVPYSYASSIVISHNLVPPTGTNIAGGSVNLAASYGDVTAQQRSLSFSSGQIMSGYNFGVVRPSSFKPPQSGQVTSPGVITYSHLYQPGTLGTTAFSSSGGTFGYSIRVDANCNGTFESGETWQSSSSLTVGATWPRNSDGSLKTCTVEVRAIVAGGVPTNTIDRVRWNASLVWANHTGVSDPRNLTDTTTVIAGGALQLTKEVRNVTQGIGFSSSNQAKPGDVLEYRITYQNIGSAGLFNLFLLDPVPFYSDLQVNVYSGNTEVQLVCPNSSVAYVETGSVSSLSLDLVGLCSLTTAPHPDGSGPAEALLPGESGYFIYQVKVR